MSKKLYSVIGMCRQITMEEIRDLDPRGLENSKYILHCILQLLVTESDRRLILEEARLRREARAEQEEKENAEEIRRLDRISGKVA